ncbi:MAG: transporter substrate-binding domain-containing protein, partial [Longicatena sp.]
MKEQHHVSNILKKYIGDFLITFILLGIMGFLFYRLYTFSILPMKWMLVLLAILALVWLILFLSTFVRMKRWIMWVKRVFIVILCFLFGYTGFIVNKAEQSTKKVTTTELYSRVSIAVVTRNDDTLQNLSNLSNKVVALQNGNEKATATFVKKKLEAEKTVTGLTYESFDDYSSMMNALINGSVDAIVMPENKYTQFIEDNEAYTTGTKIIKRYMKKQKNAISSS